MLRRNPAVEEVSPNIMHHDTGREEPIASDVDVAREYKTFDMSQDEFDSVERKAQRSKEIIVTKLKGYAERVAAIEMKKVVLTKNNGKHAALTTRRSRRLKQNRTAAMKSRLLRRIYTEKLERQVLDLTKILLKYRAQAGLSDTDYVLTSLEETTTMKQTKL